MSGTIHTLKLLACTSSDDFYVYSSIVSPLTAYRVVVFRPRLCAFSALQDETQLGLNSCLQLHFWDHTFDILCMKSYNVMTHVAIFMYNHMMMPCPMQVFSAHTQI